MRITINNNHAARNWGFVEHPVNGLQVSVKLGDGPDAQYEGLITLGLEPKIPITVTANRTPLAKFYNKEEAEKFKAETEAAEPEDNARRIYIEHGNQPEVPDHKFCLTRRERDQRLHLLATDSHDDNRMVVLTGHVGGKRGSVSVIVEYSSPKVIVQEWYASTKQESSLSLVALLNPEQYFAVLQKDEDERLNYVTRYYYDGNNVTIQRYTAAQWAVFTDPIVETDQLIRL
jgi:hypothetical protein